jgi:hypothetical protein
MASFADGQVVPDRRLHIRNFVATDYVAGRAESHCSLGIACGIVDLADKDSENLASGFSI